MSLPNYSDLDPKALANTPRSYSPTLTDRRAVDVANGNASARGMSVDRNDTGIPTLVEYPKTVNEIVIVTSTGTVNRYTPASASTPGTIIVKPGEALLYDTPTPSSESSSGGKKDCLKDVVSGFFKDVKGMISGVIDEAKGIVTGAINDVKNLISGIGQAISCIDLDFKLKKISLKGIFSDIKKGIEDGINDAINFVKGIGDTLKEARAFLTCQKGTAYEQEEASIDDQLAKAGDEDDFAGVGSVKKNFSSGRQGTDIPMSPRRRRDIANGNASGRGFVDTQVLAAEQSTLSSVKSSAKSECAGNNSGKSLTGIGDSINISNYG